MSIHSSWNTDRIASASMAKKSPAPRRAHKRPPARLIINTILGQAQFSKTIGLEVL